MLQLEHFILRKQSLDIFRKFARLSKDKDTMRFIVNEFKQHKQEVDLEKIKFLQRFANREYKRYERMIGLNGRL